MRDRIKDLVDEAHRSASHDHWKAVEATAKRITDRFQDAAQPHGRCVVLFYEVGHRGGREFVEELQAVPHQAPISHKPAPLLAPYVQLVDDYAPRGVVAADAEQVRLWGWRLAVAEPLSVWRFDRDTKPQSAGTRRATGPGQTHPRAGAHQGGPHLEELRQRFLRSAGNELASEVGRQDWSEVLFFGHEADVRQVINGMSHAALVRHAGDQDLVHARPEEIAERVDTVIGDLNRSRKLELAERAGDAAAAGGRGTLGIQETLEALAEGRVAQLLFEPGRDYTQAPLPDEFEAAIPDTLRELPLDEQMIEQALRTGASAVQFLEDTAEALDPHEGVASLLRF